MHFSPYLNNPPRLVLVRPLAKSFAHALAEKPPLVPIDVVLAEEQHQTYQQLLAEVVAKVVVVPEAHEFPDSCFIEDTLIVVGEHAIITRPGAASRRGETAGVEATVKQLIAGGEPLRLTRIADTALLDGGDVLCFGGKLFVGLSRRTNRAALAELSKIVDCPVVGIPVPEGLHLKSALSAIDDQTLVVADNATSRAMALAISQTFAQSIQTIVVPDTVAANVLRLGQTLVLQAGYPQSEPLLRQACRERGLIPQTVSMSEFAKADGALTCCSVIIP